MNLKTYYQNLEVAQPNNSLELNPELIEKFKNQVAVLPTPVKVGDEMTVIDFKGENPQQLQLVCALGGKSALICPIFSNINRSLKSTGN